MRCRGLRPGDLDRLPRFLSNRKRAAEKVGQLLGLRRRVEQVGIIGMQSRHQRREPVANFPIQLFHGLVEEQLHISDVTSSGP